MAFIPEVRHAPYPEKSKLPCHRMKGEENLTFPPPTGEKRRSQRPEGRGFQAREEIPIRGPEFQRRHCRTVPPRGPAFSRIVSEQRCLISIPHSFPVCEGNILKCMFCSSAYSFPQQSSSLGDLLPEMMESETPPHASSPHEAGDAEVSSRRASPDPPRPEVNTSAA